MEGVRLYPSLLYIFFSSQFSNFSAGLEEMRRTGWCADAASSRSSVGFPLKGSGRRAAEDTMRSDLLRALQCGDGEIKIARETE